MPFLFVMPKRDGAAAAVNSAHLGTLLCPYRGEVARQRALSGDLYVSALAERNDSGDGRTTYVLPRGTRKTPQTAWLEIRENDDGLVFETDPLGTFPLWWYEDDARVVLTSEAKSLLAVAGVDVAVKDGAAFAEARRAPDFSPFRNVRRVYPGAIARVSRDARVIEERRTPLHFRPCSFFGTAAESAAELKSVLTESARAIATNDDGRASGGGWGAFLSGGIDSSTATALLTHHHRGIATYTLGTALGDEYADAEDLAAHLGAHPTRVFASGEDAAAHFERAVFCSETVDGLTAETLAQLSLLAAVASKRVRRVVTGYGADLLFGSMLRHKLYMQVTGVDDLQSLIERTAWTREFSPFYAWSLGIEIHHLFWDPAVMNCAFRIPETQSFDGAREKLVLRRLAVESGLMDERHAFRRKQALTDGTQFNRVLSATLGLSDGYAYSQKNERCIEQLRSLFATARTTR